MKFVSVASFVTVLVAITFASPKVTEARQPGRCPDMCPAVYDPVCASNNNCIRTFGNGCELGVFNCPLPPPRRYIVIPKHYCNLPSTRNYYHCQIKEDTTL